MQISLEFFALSMICRVLGTRGQLLGSTLDDWLGEPLKNHAICLGISGECGQIPGALVNWEVLANSCGVWPNLEGNLGRPPWGFLGRGHAKCLGDVDEFLWEISGNPWWSLTKN